MARTLTVVGVHCHPEIHYYASLLVRHGESVTVVQHRLGHASATEPLNTYAHLWPDSADQTRAAIAAEPGSDDAAVSWLCPDGTS
jgi:integrase